MNIINNNQQSPIQSLIQSRLNKISELRDRRIVRSVLNDVFSSMVDYNMNMYEKLEHRVYDEIKDPMEKFYIYTSLQSLDNIDPIDDFLHPMIKSDIENKIFDMMETKEKLRGGEEVVIASVFMKCNISMFKELIEGDRVYKGFIKAEAEGNINVHEIKAYVKPCSRYIKEIEKLYNIFQKNSIEWSTINCPYAYKFIDIVIKELPQIKDDEVIKEISVNLEEYEPFKELNAVPLWNIDYIKAKDAEFPNPMPAIDTIIYEHRIQLEDYGLHNGFMVGFADNFSNDNNSDADNKDYLYIKRKNGDLIISSSDNNQAFWNLIRISSIENIKNSSGYAGELLSNRKELGFIGKLSSIKSLIIRTRGELARLLQSYETYNAVSNQTNSKLIFDDVAILENYNRTIKTFDFNGFIDDNIRIDKFKKIMVVKFKAANEYNSYGTFDYLLQDKMSFLVSELQLLFPEYRCIGEIV